MISTKIAEQIQDSLLVQMDSGTVPDKIMLTREYRSFKLMSKFRNNGCVYLTSIVKLMVHKHPELLDILQEKHSE